MAIPELAGVPVLVTGGAGFIGSHLVDALVERGAVVRVLDNLATGAHANLSRSLERIDLVEADIRDPEACRAACDGRHLVFHQAALGSVPRSVEDPVTSLAVNVQGTVNVFDACRRAGVATVVYASSSSVYGDSESLPKVEGCEGRPLSPYAASKRMGEELAEVFARTYRATRLVGLRYFNVYGPRQAPDGPYAAVIPRFFKLCLAGEAPVIDGDGEQSRDFTYVGDAVAANLLAAAAEGGDSVVVNVAAGSAASVNEIARRIGQLTGSTAKPVHGPTRPGDVRASLADLSRATAVLGYTASTSLAEGLERTFRYYTPNR